MSDDKSNRGGADRQRISLTQDYERRDWARKFGVTEDQLTQAVQKVGPMAKDVEQELQRNGSGSGSGSQR